VAVRRAGFTLIELLIASVLASILMVFVMETFTVNNFAYTRIDAVVGQWLLAGEPVGTLSSPQDGNPELYFELRRAGQPINPLPWLATTGDKVRG
jgi:prepilin-type N-terminal cleavage/methylation domain-containing protein